MKIRIFKNKDEKYAFLKRWALRLQKRNMSINAICLHFKTKGYSIDNKTLKKLLEESNEK